MGDLFSTNMTEQEEYENIEKENIKLKNRLKSEGHTCIQILESYPSQVEWCRQQTCISNNPIREDSSDSSEE